MHSLQPELLENETVRRVIVKFIAMLDKQPMAGRTAPLSVPGNEKQLPELFNPPNPRDDEEAEAALKQAEAAEVLQIKYRDRFDFESLRHRKFSILFNPAMESACRELLGMPLKEGTLSWIKAVRDARLDGTVEAALCGISPLSVPERSYDEVAGRIAAYLREKGGGHFIRQASSWMFWGMSKLLDNRPDICEILGLRPAPVHLGIYVPKAGASQVLFIENRQSYEYAKRTPDIFGEYMLVYASGFAGTAQRIRERKGSTILLDSEGESGVEALVAVKEWLYGGRASQVFFWGDFDYSGIAIFLALKKNFPDAMLWTRGYEEMARAVKTFGHTPEQSGKAKQIAPPVSDEPYIETHLRPLMEQYGFYDQEGVFF